MLNKKIEIRDILFKYGLFGLLRLGFSIALSRSFFNNVRIIRVPFYIRGSKFIFFGKNFTAGVGLRVDAFVVNNIQPKIIFSENVEVNDYVHIAAIECVSIGRDTLIASKVFITDHNHGEYSLGISNKVSTPYEIPHKRRLYSEPVIIGSRVWIGEGAMILPGVTIGDGSIIGAGSIVTKSIPENSIAVGNPAKVIKKYFPELGLWK